MQRPQTAAQTTIDQISLCFTENDTRRLVNYPRNLLEVTICEFNVSQRQTSAPPS